MFLPVWINEIGNSQDKLLINETSVSLISTDWLIQLISIKSDVPIFINLSIDKLIPIFIDWLLRTCCEFAMTQNAGKRCCWHCNISPDWCTSHQSRIILLKKILQWHTRVYGEMFGVTSKELKQRERFEILSSEIQAYKKLWSTLVISLEVSDSDL